MKHFQRDLSFALGSMQRAPWLSMLVVLTFALGIGANSALFSLVNGVLLRPLPYGDPDRIVRVYGQNGDNDTASLSPPDFLDFRTRTEALDPFAAYVLSDFSLTGGDRPEAVSGAEVTTGFFTVMGVSPTFGRAPSAEEERTGRHRVAVLGDALWHTRLGGDPDIVDRQIRLDGEVYTVIGVMPPGFAFPEEAQIWVPLTFEAEDMQVRRFHFLAGVGRLAPGADVERADQELDAVAARLEQTYPEDNKDWRVSVVPLRETLLGDVRPALLMLFGAVGLVLLIACANIANILLVKAFGREKEMAIRSALGGSGSRLGWQMLTESVVLGLAGGALGLLFALATLRILVRVSPGNIPRLEEVGLDWQVLLFTLVLVIGTSLLFGLAPALHAARPDLQGSLKEGGRNASSGTRQKAVRNSLVVVELALSALLLIGAGLLLLSFYHLSRVDPGFSTRNVLTGELSISGDTYETPEKAAGFYERLLERVSALPGVERAAVINQLPLSGQGTDTSFTIEGRPMEGDDKFYSYFRTISSDYFEAMSIPLLRGRAFTGEDRAGSSRVVIISESLAERYFPDQNPVGETLVVDLGDAVHARIVGVVGSIRHASLEREPWVTIYLPYQQEPWNYMNVVLQARSDPEALSGALRAAVRDVDPDEPVRIRTMDSLLASAVARPRFNLLVLGFLAMVALALSVVGIYGVISYSVSQRTQEIGIRMALGARRGHTLKMILREGLTLVVIGLGVGLAAAVVLSKVLESMLFEVGQRNPMIFAGVPAAIILVSLLACYFPARRASRIDPAIAIEGR